MGKKKSYQIDYVFKLSIVWKEDGFADLKLQAGDLVIQKPVIEETKNDTVEALINFVAEVNKAAHEKTSEFFSMTIKEV